VAGNGAFVPHRHCVAYTGDFIGELDVSRWQPVAPRQHEAEVTPLQREHVEVTGEPWPGVQPTARSRDPHERVAVVQVGRLESSPLYPFDDKCVQIRQVGKNARRDAGRRRRDRVRVLRIAVDRQQS